MSCGYSLEVTGVPPSLSFLGTSNIKYKQLVFTENRQKYTPIILKYTHFSCVMGKSAFCICENDADQLHGDYTADQ